MRIVFVLLCAVVLHLPQGLRAQTNAVVLELFTSQGCSSCPPADALLTELAEQPGIIALALHVDYWDYLGWKDSFGHAVFTERQYKYAKRHGKRSVFTPQMVVQGQHMLIGHDRDNILRSVRALRQLPAKVGLEVRRDGDRLTIGLDPREPLDGPIAIHVVSFIPSVEVAIDAGENAGRNITYSSVATDWTTVARWDGKAAVELVHEGLVNRPVAVIVQRAGIGPVLSAAKLP